MQTQQLVRHRVQGAADDLRPARTQQQLRSSPGVTPENAWDDANAFLECEALSFKEVLGEVRTLCSSQNSRAHESMGTNLGTG